jgi:microcystin-dependent protein
MYARWAGTLSSVPAGWKVCYGTQNTPDLLSRFVVGYSVSTYKINEKGGSNLIVLTANQMPEHTHTLKDPGHVHSGSISHSHYLKYLKMLDISSGKKSSPGGAGDGISNLTSNSVNLKPSVEVSSSTVINSVSAVGKGKAIENRPPYYVVIFIMKE